jgi:gas vesicle protein
MIDIDNKNKKEVNPLAAAVVGVAVGAGLAVAGAIALNDKKNSDKLKEAGKEFEAKTTDYSKKVQMMARDRRSDLEKNIEEVKEQTAKAVTKLTDKLK